jgi:hypothetical protein
LSYVDNTTGARTVEGTGYSGNGTGLNNPDSQNVANVGPAPQGEYSIGTGYQHATEGPNVMNLTPTGNLMNNMFGRSAIHIHGDNSRNDHSASEGCIILGKDLRKKINESTDKILWVVP